MARQPHLDNLDQFIIGRVADNQTYKASFEVLKDDIGFVISDTAPTDPINGTLWVNASIAACPPELLVYSECSGTGQWYPIGGSGGATPPFLEYDANGDVFVDGDLYIDRELHEDDVLNVVSPITEKWIQVSAVTGDCNVKGDVFTDFAYDILTEEGFPGWSPVGRVEADVTDSITIKGRLIVSGNIIVRGIGGDVITFPEPELDLHTDHYITEAKDVCVDDSTLTNGDILVWDRGCFTNKPLEVEKALGELIDVELTDPQPDDVLVYDGTNWVNQPNTIEEGYLEVDASGNVYVPGDLYVGGVLDKASVSVTPVLDKNVKLYNGDAHISGDVYAAVSISSDAYVDPERWVPVARVELSSANELSVSGKLVVKGKIHVDLPASEI